MKLFTPVVLAVLTTLVAADVRHAYERVWLYYAYKVEMLLPEHERKIGYGCVGWNAKTGCPESFDRLTAKKEYLDTVNNPKPCTPATGTICTFLEFMVQLDGWKDISKYDVSMVMDPKDTTTYKKTLEDHNRDPANNPKPDPANNPELNPDPDSAAKWYGKRAQAYHPYYVMHDLSSGYASSLKKIGTQSAQTLGKLSADVKAANKGDIDRMQHALKAVRDDRIRDQEAAMERDRKAKGFQLKYFASGDVNWKASSELNKVKANEFKAFKQRALDHTHVIKLFGSIEDMYTGKTPCG